MGAHEWAEQDSNLCPSLCKKFRWVVYRVLTPHVLVRTYAVGGRTGVFGRATPAQTPPIFPLNCVTPISTKSFEWLSFASDDPQGHRPGVGEWGAGHRVACPQRQHP